jgi:adenylate cyclase
MYSPYLSALTLSNLINNSYLIPCYEKLGLILAIIFLIIFQLIFYQYFSPPAFISTALITIFAAIFSSLIAYTNFNIHLQVTPLIFVIFTSLMYTVSKRYYKEYAEKHRIKNAFQHYVTASVVNEILKNPEKLNLHGEERDLTIFFSDIEGFTTLSEGMSPLDVVSLLNEYLSEMTEIIFKFEGLLDKYEGDAIMAVFGAPVNQKDHAIRACRCALENQKALAKLRKKWIKEGKPPINARIGINTGMVVVGNMGSKMRFDYTVIGDNVNLAARLETANKIMKTSILVSEHTAQTAEPAIISRYLGKLKVAGKKEKVKVYEVLADNHGDNKQALEIAKTLKLNYEKAHNFYLDRNFNEAEKILKEHIENYPDDKPAAMLLEKAKGFQIVPPPPSWEDIITQENK